MLAILSPAKSLNTDPVSTTLPRREHPFVKDSAVLLKRAQRLKPSQLQVLMDISENLATLNRDRFQQLSFPLGDDALPAALLFDGDVYKGLDARSLSDADLAWAEDHLAILSGLYGILRPLDRTHPYRLEMGTALDTRRGRDLYAFWGDRLAKWIDAALVGHEDPVLIDLASNEYNRAVPKQALKAERLTIQFKELRNGKPQVISFFAKRARGLMARFMVEQRATHRDQLRAFGTDGYAYDASLSKPLEWVFTRE